MARTIVYPLLAMLLVAPSVPLEAQQPPPPPAVGVVKVLRKAITESTEFIGRIQAVERVDLSARVTAFLDKRLFTEGTEVEQGELLYQLERAPFEADMQTKQAAVKQAQALLKNADLTLARAQDLLAKAVGTAATADTAEAGQQSQAALLLAAQAQLRQSEINLSYTEIRAPIAGRIGRTSITPGNVVSPGSGVLATIVSQDPMYVVFSVPVRTALDLRRRIAQTGSFEVARIKLKLPDGRMYGHTGKLDFLNNTVTGNTDTLMLRATIPNPVEKTAHGDGAGANRELVDGEFVGVLLEDAQPVEALVIPRAAVLSDQAGDYVYIVDAAGKAQRQRVKLGQSTPTLAVVTSGLEEGQAVIVDGLQRVRPGQPVSPAPAANAEADSADSTGQRKL